MTDVTQSTPSTDRAEAAADEPPPAAAGRRRNPRGEGDKLRRDLIEAALVLLERSGDPDDVSIRAIARATGVSPTAAYRHFVDRDDLVYNAIGLAFEEFADLLAESLEGADGPFERLAAAGTGYRRFATEHQGRYRVLFSNPMACPAQTTALDEEIDAASTAFSMLVGLIQDCLDAGAAAGPDADAERLALQLWTWIHGIVDLRITHPEMPWPDAAEMFDDARHALGLD